MKKLSVSILVPSIVAAGAVVAAAQNVPYYDYPLNVQLTRPPTVISVAGLPTPTYTLIQPMLQGSIGTDGSGKIDGVQYARVYFPGAGNTNNYASFVINVSGTVRTIGTAPAVRMTLRGYGYSVDAFGDHPNARLSLTFTSTNAPVTISPSQQLVITNSNFTVTYANGSPVLLTTNVPPTYSGLYINPTNYAVTFLFTNGPGTEINNNRYSAIGGRLTGTITLGTKSVFNGGKPWPVNEAASLFSESLLWTVVNDTNFVQQSVGGSVVMNVLSNITGQVIQPQSSPLTPPKNLYLSLAVGSAADPYSGTATVSYSRVQLTNTYKARLTGVSSARGAVLNVNGTMGPVIVGFQNQPGNPLYPTGYSTNYLFYAIKGISFSGKVLGQTVPLTSGVNPNAPFPLP